MTRARALLGFLAMLAATGGLLAGCAGPRGRGGSPNWREQGLASWYGADFHGRRTANGERYNMYAMTAAHKTLPLGTQIVVINQRDRPAHPGAGERPGTVRRGPHRRPLPGGGAGTRVGRGGCRARDPRGRPAGLGLRDAGAASTPGPRRKRRSAAGVARRRAHASPPPLRGASRSRSAPSRSRATPAGSRRACRCRRARPGCCPSRTTAAPGGGCGSAGTTASWRRAPRPPPLRNSDSPASSSGKISPAARQPGCRGRRGASAAARPRGR